MTANHQALLMVNSAPQGDATAIAIRLAVEAWWDFEQNDATNQFLDSKNANHLTTYNAGAITTAGMSASTGKMSRGMTNAASETNRTAYIPRSNTNLDLSNSSFSFGGWFNLPSSPAGDYRYLIGRVGSTLTGSKDVSYIMQDASGGGIQFVAKNSSVVNVGTALFALAAGWNFIISTFDRAANTIRLRIRNASTPGSTSDNTVAFPDPLYTAANTANFSLFDAIASDSVYFSGNHCPVSGQADACFYMNRVLTDDEFTFLYNNGIGLTFAQLTALANGTIVLPPTIAGNTGWWDWTNPYQVIVAPGYPYHPTTDGEAIYYNNSYGNYSGYHRTIQQNNVLGMGNYKPALINGKSACRFDSDNSIRGNFERRAIDAYTSPGTLTVTDLFSTTGKTVIMAISIQVTSAQVAGGTYNNNPLLGDTGNRFQIGCQTIDASNCYLTPYNYDGTEDVVQLSVPKNTWMIIAVRHDGTNLSIRRDSGAWTSVASGATNSYTGDVTLGLSGGHFTEWDMAHFATFNVALSDANIRIAEAYMAQQLGITLA